MQRWYVRSAAQADAHYGQQDRHNTVTARCGLIFTPQPDLFEHGPLFLHPPIDPARYCPQCWTALATTDPASLDHRTTSDGGDHTDPLRGVHDREPHHPGLDGPRDDADALRGVIEGL